MLRKGRKTEAPKDTEAKGAIQVPRERIPGVRKVLAYIGEGLSADMPAGEALGWMYEKSRERGGQEGKTLMDIHNDLLAFVGEGIRFNGIDEITEHTPLEVILDFLDRLEK